MVNASSYHFIAFIKIIIAGSIPNGKYSNQIHSGIKGPEAHA